MHFTAIYALSCQIPFCLTTDSTFIQNKIMCGNFHLLLLYHQCQSLMWHDILIKMGLSESCDSLSLQMPFFIQSSAIFLNTHSIFLIFFCFIFLKVLFIFAIFFSKSLTTSSNQETRDASLLFLFQILLAGSAFNIIKNCVILMQVSVFLLLLHARPSICPRFIIFLHRP